MAVINNKTESETLERMKLHLADSSRALADLTANMVYDKPHLLKLLIELSFQEKGPLAQRASRVVAICCCRFPEYFKPFASTIIQRLGEIKWEGALRNFLMIFAEVPIKLNDKANLQLLNLCFNYLTGSNAVSIKVYSMEIIYRCSGDYPEIRNELCQIIEDQLPEASAGFRSRGAKILKKCMQADGFGQYQATFKRSR